MERIGVPSIYCSENVSYQVNIHQSAKGKQGQAPHSCVQLSSNDRNEVHPGLDLHSLTCGENVSYGVRTHWTTERQWGSEKHYNDKADSYDYIDVT